MDPKDELLAKLKAIDAEVNPSAPKPELKPVSPPAPTVETAPDISTDDFLAKLEALDQATRPAPPPIPSVAPTPAQPAQGHSQAAHSAPSQSSTPPSGNSSPTSQQSGMGQPVGESGFSQPASTSASAQSSPPVRYSQPYAGFPNVIERLKQFTQEQLAAHAAQNQAKAKRTQEIARAQAWLDKLDPLSDDGFWFEQFAESYESRIQAALDFLNPGKSK